MEGLSEYHTGAVGLSDKCTVEEAEVGLNAGIELIEQGNGYIIVRANDIKPIIDLPIYLTYGANITIVPSPEYVGEANRHVDTTAYSSKWVKSVDGWQQEVDVEGITSNSIGTMGLRNGASELQSYAAAVGRIKITKVYDNKVLLTATKIKPNVNIPLCFVFGRNINVAKYPGVVGKVSLDSNYIPFDDSLIGSNMSSLQQLLEYFNTVDIKIENKLDLLIATNEADHNAIRNSITNLELANDIEHNVIRKSISDLNAKNEAAHTNINNNIANLQDALGNTVIRIQATQPTAIPNKNIIWIKI